MRDAPQEQCPTPKRTFRPALAAYTPHDGYARSVPDDRAMKRGLTPGRMHGRMRRRGAFAPRDRARQHRERGFNRDSRKTLIGA